MQSVIFKSTIVAQVVHSINIEASTKAKCPFGYGGNSTETLVQTVDEVTYLEEMFSDSLEFSENLTEADYDSIATAIFANFDGLSSELGAQSNKRGSMVACLLRTAGHDFMDYRVESENEGGSDGCINFEDEDNGGLQQCLTEFGIPALFDEHKDKVSLADFIVIIAEAAMARAHSSYADVNAVDSLFNKFRNGFKWGRRSVADCAWNTGRMPSPEHGCHGKDGKDGLEQIFIDNIYKDVDAAWTMVAAISGAHTVGGATQTTSGYNGYWSDVEQQGIFNNDYYRSLMTKGWKPETAINGNAGKNQWMRADIPISKTEEELAADGLSTSIYKVQLDALTDPTRGLLENPEVGIKGHHEFMLTSDMCLAFTRNEAFDNCQRNKNPYWNEDYGKLMLSQHTLECRDNLWEAKYFEDIWPEDGECCAWIKPKNMYNFGIWNYDVVATEERRVCNVDITDEFISTETCCQNMSNHKDNCGESYWGGGPAYEDIMEFARDEDIWIRKYLEAWHYATENGSTELKWLSGEETGLQRHALEAKHEVDCRGLEYETCRATDECHEVTVGMAPTAVQHWLKACRNKHLLVSEQQNEGETFRNYEAQYMVHLEKAAQSSDLSDLYLADNALNRQNKVENEAAGKNFHFHPFLHKEDDDSTKNNKQGRFMTSCSISEPVSADQPMAWWSAEFSNGPEEVKEVEVWGEIYKVLWDRYYFGAKVYVDDQLCAEITTFTQTEQMDGTNGYGSSRKYGNGYRVICDTPLTGSSVRIEQDRESKDTDIYQAGLAICDVKVHTTAAEPVFQNKYADLFAEYAGVDEHVDWDLPLAEVGQGIAKPHAFEESGYMLRR